MPPSLFSLIRWIFPEIIAIFVEMKRLFCILVAVFVGVLSLSAQRAEVGSYAPYIGGVEWISDRLEESDKALMVEFFHSSNKDCRDHIEHLNALACDYRYDMDVLMLTREPAEQVAGMLLHEYQYFYVAIDESGKVFRAFDVSHVPYAVIINPKGIIVWAGNPLSLTDLTIKKLLHK